MFLLCVMISKVFVYPFFRAYLGYTFLLFLFFLFLIFLLFFSLQSFQSPKGIFVLNIILPFDMSILIPFVFVSSPHYPFLFVMPLTNYPST
uniref:Putative ovule protein n=1 Tax=Solanum chacoense TaxID=4108 RepID=A0A0V0GP39_SOLCH